MPLETPQPPRRKPVYSATLSNFAPFLFSIALCDPSRPPWPEPRRPPASPPRRPVAGGSPRPSYHAPVFPSDAATRASEILHTPQVVGVPIPRPRPMRSPLSDAATRFAIFFSANSTQPSTKRLPAHIFLSSRVLFAAARQRLVISPCCSSRRLTFPGLRWRDSRQVDDAARHRFWLLFRRCRRLMSSGAFLTSRAAAYVVSAAVVKAVP